MIKMRKFDYETAPRKWMTPEVAALIASLREYKGRQALYLRATPDVLDSLFEIAKIQSTASSNRIEGISTTDARIRALVACSTSPRNRAEEEISGYRDVLATIHELHGNIPLTPGVILQFHRDLMAHIGPGIGGSWKMSDNVISETDATGRTFVRFRPLPAFETPAAIEALCDAANQAFQKRKLDPMFIAALFTLDFVSIHPFNDGNGRMSRLLTLLLSYKAGYDVGRYISIEKVIEDSKLTYYETLQASSANWLKGRNTPEPFIRYLLGVFIKAFSLFEERVSDVLAATVSKEGRVRLLFERTALPLRKRQILEACPGVSGITVARALKSLLDAGKIRKIGGGPATAYVKVR